MAHRSTDHNMVCGPRDSPSNVILRILKKHVPSIASGEKNHEYRDYILDAEVTKVWLYVDGDEEIQYILTIGPYKIPGQVNDPSGLGNNDFDNGLKTNSRFGYKIHEVRKLPHVLGKQELLTKFGVDMYTRGKQYVKKALVDEFPQETTELVVPKDVAHM